jgi:hypothetical protein
MAVTWQQFALIRIRFKNKNRLLLQRSCPKCNGYLGIVVPVQAINGRCVICGYRVAWVLGLGSVREESSDPLRNRGG